MSLQFPEAVPGDSRKRKLGSDGDSSSGKVVVTNKKEDGPFRPFDTLPDEIVAKIFSNLDGFSVRRVSGLCRRFWNVVCEYGEEMNKVEIDILEVVSLQQGIQVGFNLKFVDDSRRQKLFVMPMPFLTEEEMIVIDLDDFQCDLTRGPAPNKDLFNDVSEAFRIFLNSANVKRILFDRMHFTADFCEKLLKEVNLGTSYSVEWLNFAYGELSLISSDCFGRFIAMFGPSKVEFHNMKYRLSDGHFDTGNVLLKEAVLMNPQLTGISLHTVKNVVATESATFEYGQIFPIHIVGGSLSKLDDIVDVVREWTAGTKDIIKIDTGPPKMSGAVLVKGNLELFLTKCSANIVNVKGERLNLRYSDRYSDDGIRLEIQCLPWQGGSKRMNDEKFPFQRSTALHLTQ